MKTLVCAMLAIFGVQALCEESPEPVSFRVLFGSILNGPAFELDLFLPEKKEALAFSFKDSDRQINHLDLKREFAPAEESYGLNRTGFFQTIEKAFILQKAPGLRLLFHFPNKPDVAVYAKGHAESTYMLKHLLSSRGFKTWARDNVKPPPNACPIVVQKSNANNSLPAIETPTDASMKALKLAKSVYDERRAELIVRCHESWLYYADADNTDWSVSQKDNSWFVSSSASDLMYYAHFTFEIQPDATGALQCIGITGGEFFKGE